jgi:hypothetical protein
MTQIRCRCDFRIGGFGTSKVGHGIGVDALWESNVLPSLMRRTNLVILRLSESSVRSSCRTNDREQDMDAYPDTAMLLGAQSAYSTVYARLTPSEVAALVRLLSQIGMGTIVIDHASHFEHRARTVAVQKVHGMLVTATKP